MVGKAAVIPVNFNPPPMRRDDEQVQGSSSTPTIPTPGAADSADAAVARAGPGRLTAAQVTEQVDAWLVANGALVRINDAAMDHGLIRAFNNRTFDPAKAAADGGACATKTTAASSACWPMAKT